MIPLNKFPKVELSHTPTPLELMPNLSKRLGGPEIWVKRDDCTGLAMGGNKARQLEYYIGQARAVGADTLLTTGATQSNHVRMTIAAARKLGMQVEVQLEKRVAGRQPEYYTSGNPMLMQIMGAKIHHYPEGEDEEGADQAMYDRANELKSQGASPYVIPLSGMHTPFGALGYVEAAQELIYQSTQKFDAIITPSGSANTHAGIILGLRGNAKNIPVYGICVRRVADLQYKRVLNKSTKLMEMLELEKCFSPDDVKVDDSVLAPGYGQLSEPVVEAIKITAESEGILLDPTYTGKTMAGLIRMIGDKFWTKDQRILFWHTGGTPGLFGYPEIV